MTREIYRRNSFFGVYSSRCLESMMAEWRHSSRRKLSVHILTKYKTESKLKMAWVFKLSNIFSNKHMPLTPSQTVTPNNNQVCKYLRLRGTPHSNTAQNVILFPQIYSESYCSRGACNAERMWLATVWQDYVVLFWVLLALFLKSLKSYLFRYYKIEKNILYLLFDHEKLFFYEVW